MTLGYGDLRNASEQADVLAYLDGAREGGVSMLEARLHDLSDRAAKAKRQHAGLPAEASFAVASIAYRLVAESLEGMFATARAASGGPKGGRPVKLVGDKTDKEVRRAVPDPES